MGKREQITFHFGLFRDGYWKRRKNKELQLSACNGGLAASRAADL